MHVKPIKGKSVLDPASGKELPPDGDEVRDTPYWRRLERRGDVTAARSEAEATAAKAAPAPARRAPRTKRPLAIGSGGKLAGSLTVGKKKG